MNSEVISFSYGQHELSARIDRRARKTLAIAVLPDCTIRATAPLDASPEKLRERLHKRARWIVRQLRYFAQFQPHTTERQFVSGETHLYLGRQYRIKVHTAPEQTVKLKGAYFHIACADGPGSQAGQLLWSWYRERAEVKFTERLEECMARFRDQTKPTLTIRKLKRRWGSLSSSARLTLNLDLIRAPVECIDYVIIHELCHLEHPHHGRAFIRLLSARLHNWQALKQKLELRLC